MQANVISLGSHEISWPAFVMDFHYFVKNTFLHMFPSFPDYLTVDETQKLIGACVRACVRACVCVCVLEPIFR